MANALSTGALFDLLKNECGGFDFLHHWQQGEFHQDLVLSVKEQHGLPGPILVVSTNSNAGVKEVLCLDQVPTEARSGTCGVRTSSNSPARCPPFSRLRGRDTGSTRRACSPPTREASTARSFGSVSLAAAGD